MLLDTVPEKKEYLARYEKSVIVLFEQFVV